MLCSMDGADVGLLGFGWEPPYLRPGCPMLGGPWEGEDPPRMGLVGGGGPRGLTLWYQGHGLGGGCLWGCWESLSTLDRGVVEQFNQCWKML